MKKTLAFVLSLVLVLALFPLLASAEEECQYYLLYSIDDGAKQFIRLINGNPTYPVSEYFYRIFDTNSGTSTSMTPYAEALSEADGLHDSDCVPIAIIVTGTACDLTGYDSINTPVPSGIPVIFYNLDVNLHLDDDVDLDFDFYLVGDSGINVEFDRNNPHTMSIDGTPFFGNWATAVFQPISTSGQSDTIRYAPTLPIAVTDYNDLMEPTQMVALLNALKGDLGNITVSIVSGDVDAHGAVDVHGVTVETGAKLIVNEDTTIKNLDVNSGGEVDLYNKTLTLTGTAKNEGTIIALPPHTGQLVIAAGATLINDANGTIDVGKLTINGTMVFFSCL